MGTSQVLNGEISIEDGIVFLYQLGLCKDSIVVSRDIRID